jgi:hypothetical protein
MEEESSVVQIQLASMSLVEEYGSNPDRGLCS